MKRRYDFETVIDRGKQGSSKWAQMKTLNPEVAEGIVPLSVADMEFVLMPEVAEEIKNVVDTTILGYTSPSDSYYESVINWMKRRHQWHIEKEWFTITCGIVPAICILVKTLCNPGEGVVLLTPVYPPFFKAIENNDNKIISSSLIDNNGYYEIDFEDLEAKLSKPNNTMMILCSPHNPIGRIWKKEELCRIMDLCLKYNVVMIADEIHHDIVAPGEKHTVLAAISAAYQDNVITCTSVSKTFNLAGMQISNIIIKNERYRQKLERYLELISIRNASILAYPALETAYNKGEQWLEEMIAVVMDNYNYLCEYLQQHLPQLKVYPIEATYLAWVDCRQLFTDYRQLEEFLIFKAQAFFNQGYTFGKEGQGFVRINLACPQKVLADCLERIVEAYNG